MIKTKIRPLVLTCLLALVVTLLGGCRQKASDPRPTVVVTIEPYHYFVDQIAKGRIKVVTLVPPGATPETYEPTARQLADAGEARAMICVGNLPMEKLLVSRLSQSSEKLIVADASQGLKLATSINGIPDPHVWMSALNAVTIARNILSVLCKIDPDHTDDYHNNYLTFCKKAMKYDAQLAQSLQSTTNRAFVIYHPALTYFARDYKLTQLPIEEEGREPSPRQLEQLIRMAKQLHAKTILAQKGTGDRSISTVAEALNLKPQTINPLDYHWDKQLNAIAHILAPAKSSDSAKDKSGTQK